jgi:hypothetical protein
VQECAKVFNGIYGVLSDKFVQIIITIQKYIKYYLDNIKFISNFAFKLIINVNNRIMKNILLAFLFCFAAMLYAAPPEAIAPPPDLVVQNSTQKVQPIGAIQAQEISNFIFIPQANHVGVQENSQILQPSFWRQSENQNLIYNNLFSFSAPNTPLYHRLSLADKVFSSTKILPSLPRYCWGNSKVILSKTR